jgi:hypothetical protein
MIGGTIVIVLLVLVFIFTFVIPIAKNKVDAEAFQANMGNYNSERARMRDTGNQLYNELGVSLDPLLPTFALLNETIDPTLPVQQYARAINRRTNDVNKEIDIALQTPDGLPSRLSSTNLGIKAQKVQQSLPPANDLYIQALKCETDINSRADCSKLDNPQYSLCGVCIKEGTKFDGSETNTFIGGLLSIFQDRSAQEDNAANGPIYYQPTLGKCPPGMFFVTSASCKEAVNKQNCQEIGETGGFNGGKTAEGKNADEVSCASAPLSGTNTFVYQPADKPNTVLLRILSPFTTGITKVVVTVKRTGKTYTADNNGKPGTEFTLSLPDMIEADDVTVLVAQEAPNRRLGQPEVFQVLEQLNRNTGAMKKYTQTLATDVCNRLGASLATKAQVDAAVQNGIQSQYCGLVSDSSSPVYAAQTGGARMFGLIPVGGNPGSGTCDSSVDANFNAAWCYGTKPDTILPVSFPKDIPTLFNSWFQSFGTNASPAQGPSLYSRYGTVGADAPLGFSNRAVIIQWEMQGSANRTVPFQQTITGVDTGPASSLWLGGPLTGSSIISGPAWNSNMTMQKNQFWFWSQNGKNQTVIFKSKVPGYLNNPYYPDDVQTAPIGPLISKQSTANLLKTPPCMLAGQVPGKYSAECLLTLFQGAGGVPGKGTLTQTNGGISQLNNLGSLDSITTYLGNMRAAAMSGKDANGNVLSQDMTTRVNAMNTAATQLFGFNMLTVCEQIVDNRDGSVGVVPVPMTQMTPACLQYLWLNTGQTTSRIPGRKSRMGNTFYDATYTSIQDRFSGLLNNESTPELRTQYPFQACQLTGVGAPIKNGKPDMTVVSYLLSLGSVKAIQDYFNNIYTTANALNGGYTGTPLQVEKQGNAILQCYGVKQSESANKSLGYGCDIAKPTPPAPACNPSPCDPSCPKNGEGISSVNTSGGYNIRLYTNVECTKLGGNFAGNGKSTWGLPNNSVGECLGTPGGNIGFCNNLPNFPPSAAAATAVGK